MTRRYADEYEGDAALKRLIDDGEEVTAKTVFDLAKEGDDLALIVYRTSHVTWESLVLISAQS